MKMTDMHPIPLRITDADHGLCLPLITSHVPCGFPSPAEDYALQRFNLMDYLAPHPVSTFVLRVTGDSMRDAGISDRSLIVVDRSLQAKHGHIVVAIVDGEFTVKQLYQRDGKCELQAANPAYPAITFKPGQSLEIWGVVTAAVTQFMH